MAEHNELGKWGEQVAAEYLEQKGYLICDRDWRLNKRDLDIVALTEDRKVLVIVEVKTRRNENLTEPEYAVNWSKKRNIAIATNAYVKMKGWGQELRFDIVTVVGTKGNLVAVNHIENAFNPLLTLSD